MTRIEYSVYLAAIVSSFIYTFVRVFKGQKLRYPKAYESYDKDDFIIANLGELEILTTIISPAVVGFGIYDLSPGSLLTIIQIVVAVQALIPFLQAQSKPKVKIVTEMASLVIIPLVNIVLCILFMSKEEDQKFAPFGAYTISIQVFLLLITFFKRFGCKCCCENVRELDAADENPTKAQEVQLVEQSSIQKENDGSQLQDINNADFVSTLKVETPLKADVATTTAPTKTSVQEEEEFDSKLDRSYQRVGKGLMLNEDFFSYTYVSELNTTHALITLFQSHMKHEKETKR